MIFIKLLAFIAFIVGGIAWMVQASRNRKAAKRRKARERATELSAKALEVLQSSQDCRLNTKVPRDTLIVSLANVREYGRVNYFEINFDAEEEIVDIAYQTAEEGMSGEGGYSFAFEQEEQFLAKLRRLLKAPKKSTVVSF